MRKIYKLKLGQLYENNPIANKFIKKILGLAFLPEEFIEEQYLKLKNDLPENFQRTFKAFTDYYEKQWLGQVTPAGFSVFGLANHTSNEIESYHSILVDELQVHSSPWKVLCMKNFLIFILYFTFLSKYLLILL